MSLRSKVLAIVAVVVAIYGVVDYIVQSRIIFPSFARLEREEAVADLGRCVSAIEREIQQLGTSAGDYGFWDDTAQFVKDGDSKYAEANLTTTSLKGLGVNCLYICDPQGRVVGSHTLDLSTLQAMEIPGFPKEAFPAAHALLQLKDPKDAIEGIMMTGVGPMLVASRPVLNNAGEGPVRGAVIIGKLLNADVVAKLRAQTQVEFEVMPVQTGTQASAVGSASAGDADGAAIQIDDGRSDVLYVTTTLSDLGRKPVLPIKAVVPREITAKGSAAIRFANYSIIAVGLLVLVALLASLQSVVLGPMSRLTSHVVRVGKTDDLTARLGMKARDEIGTLAAEFDRMVERLAEAQRKLVSQSFESGLAEMASGTLHNVRNALTPVLAELDMLRQDLAKAPLDQIDMAKQQLNQESVPEGRRQELSRFLDLASGQLVAVAKETHNKLGEVTVRAKCIEEFLSEQEVASRADRPMEWVVLGDLIQEAATLLPAKLRNRFTLQIGQGVVACGRLRTHRICVLQVIGNLLTNAAEAISESGQDQGMVSVDASTEETADGPVIHLCMRDDGTGIMAENLDRLFERGFTTKDGASRGMGLHWCANSVAAMGGRMSAESGGVGQGTCVHVFLPANAEAAVGQS